MLFRAALRRGGGTAVAVVGAGSLAFLVGRAADQRREGGADGHVQSFEAALPRIDATGYAVVRDCVPASALARCRETAAFCSIPAHASDPRPEGWRTTARGRFHCSRFCEADERVFEALEPLFAGLVDAFFRHHAGDGSGGSARIFRSELQLLTAAPLVSGEQIWHSDNRARGITVVVPLAVDFTLDNGATQLLPGSHDLASWASWRLLFRQGARVVTPPLGSVIVYDARTYHRGLGNSTPESRPALVFRYDQVVSPPPGVGLLASIAHTTAAKALHAVTAAGHALLEHLLQ